MQALRAVMETLRALTADGVDYIHWKSNEHLEAALLGQTDLDILISADGLETAQRVLRERECRCVYSDKTRAHPEREDWLGFDRLTGEQYHLDLHTGITIGNRIVKNYALPVVQWLLDGATQFEGVSTPAPNRELAILILRTITKTPRITRHRQIVIASELRKELDWLLDRYDAASFVNDLSGIGLPIDTDFFTGFVADYLGGRITRGTLIRTQRTLRRLLRPYRVRSDLWVAWSVVRHTLGRRILRRFVKRRKKVHARPAVFAAIVGADGSGKSTLVRDLVKWLGWKLETTTLYFGMPRKHLLVASLRKLRTGSALVSRMLKSIPLAGGATRYLADIFDATYWLLIARVRFNIYRKALRLRSRGTIVIAERYPLREFWTMERPMDGPRIPTGRRGVACLSKIERSLYDRIRRADTLFILDVPARVLETRKTDTAIPEKSEVVHAFAQTNGNDHIVLNGAEPYASVLLSIKQEIWKRL